MIRSNNSLDPRLTFAAGWLLGRRSRRRAGFGCLLIFFGLFCAGSGIMALVSAPLSWLRARDVTALPRPQPAALMALPPGTRALVTAQFLPNLPVAANGFAVFYVESSEPNATLVATGQATATTAEWHMLTPLPPRIGMVLPDRRALLVPLSPATSFLNAQQVALDGKDAVNTQRRAVGYQAGQVLTMQGTWEGNGLFTTVELYAGTPADYLADLSHASGIGLVLGFVGSGAGLLLLVVGAGLRFVGK